MQVTYNISLLRNVKKRRRRREKEKKSKEDLKGHLLLLYDLFHTSVWVQLHNQHEWTCLLRATDKADRQIDPVPPDCATGATTWRLKLPRLFFVISSESLLTVLLDTLPCQSFLKGLFDILEVVSGMFLRVIDAGGCNDGSVIVVRKLKQC